MERALAHTPIFLPFSPLLDFGSTSINDCFLLGKESFDDYAGRARVSFVPNFFWENLLERLKKTQHRWKEKGSPSISFEDYAVQVFEPLTGKVSGIPDLLRGSLYGSVISLMRNWHFASFLLRDIDEMALAETDDKRREKAIDNVFFYNLRVTQLIGLQKAIDLGGVSIYDSSGLSKPRVDEAGEIERCVEKRYMDEKTRRLFDKLTLVTG